MDKIENIPDFSRQLTSISSLILYDLMCGRKDMGLKFSSVLFCLVLGETIKDERERCELERLGLFLSSYGF